MLRFSTPIDGLEEEDDRQLIARSHIDVDAFALLYRRYLPPVYRYLLSFTGHEDDAADLTQQTFARAFTALSAYRDRGPFIAWLLRIARNAAIDARRRRRPEFSWERVPDTLRPTADGSVEASIVQREALDGLRLLVANLPDDKRDLLALRFGAGLTCPEIARVLNRSEAAVKKQLERTLRRLREEYHAQL